MKKTYIIALAIIGVVFIYYPYIHTRDKSHLFCQTTSDHEKIIQAKKLENNIPTRFVLFYDRPNKVLIYPDLNRINKEKRVDFSLFKENLKKENPLFRLELEVSGRSFDISAWDDKNFPYDYLTLYRDTLAINYIDKEKYSGRHFVVIANCKTWTMISGRGGIRKHI